VSGVRTALCVAASNDWERFKQTMGREQTRLGAADRLTASLPALMQAHLPRHASAAVPAAGG